MANAWIVQVHPTAPCTLPGGFMPHSSFLGPKTLVGTMQYTVPRGQTAHYSISSPTQLMDTSLLFQVCGACNTLPQSDRGCAVLSVNTLPRNCICIRGANDREEEEEGILLNKRMTARTPPCFALGPFVEEALLCS